jgi:hypothetical protein
MEFFRQQLERASIAEMVELRHVLEILRHVDHERPFDVALADFVLDERRLAPGFDQLGKSLFVELAVCVQAANLLEGGDCLSRVLTGFSVDHARREIGAIEQDLRAQQDGARGLERLGFWRRLRLIDRGGIEGFGGHRMRRGRDDEASGEGETGEIELGHGIICLFDARARSSTNNLDRDPRRSFWSNTCSTTAEPDFPDVQIFSMCQINFNVRKSRLFRASARRDVSRCCCRANSIRLRWAPTCRCRSRGRR